ncbi:outer membrane protein assembly factor BamB family protein [Streptomyces zagrosensis]|uniref:Pyrrolo-quinoline quinone repeat domain-containing protein n=1 Tax=Streptomyces zagrosensis TaxID=1042984 RepID=A0A7W9QG19_9ACTN|nr:PQQ-binding-like beta-propeller repeat protein [Streptomyces zagrosensis]MBB5939605.1 hypothetical protein [Streptomyces zagrosensis]
MRDSDAAQDHDMTQDGEAVRNSGAAGRQHCRTEAEITGRKAPPEAENAPLRTLTPPADATPRASRTADNTKHQPSPTTDGVPLRMLPDELFPEVGSACHVALSADGQWLAVVGYLGSAYTRVRLVLLPQRPRTRLLLYQRADLTRWHVVETPDGDPDVLAFHPALPLLAIGTDDAIDEYERSGILLLVEPETGRRAQVACADAGVLALCWRDEDTLDVLLIESDLTAPVEWEATYSECVVRRPASGDWLDLAAETSVFDVRQPPTRQWPELLEEEADTHQTGLADFACAAGLARSQRGKVWAVEGLADGRVLAASDHDLLECWSPSGQLLWAAPLPAEPRPHSGPDQQLLIASDELTARVTTSFDCYDAQHSIVLVVSLADGSLREERRLEYQALFAARADGVWAARDTCGTYPAPPSWTPSSTLLFAPDGMPLGAVPLGHYDARTELTVRRSPHLYFLVVTDGPAPDAARPEGMSELGAKRPGLIDYVEYNGLPKRQVLWLVRVSPGERGAPGTLQPLFRLGQKAAVRGGPAVYVTDTAGSALILSTDGSAGPRLTRRALPHGEPAWTLPAASAIAGVDVHAGTVYAACAAGELLTVDATTGALIDRTPLTTRGHTFTPLSLVTTATGDVVIGTLEGRLLILRIRQTAADK